MNYSATSLELLQAFGVDKIDHLYITNSISEDIKYLRRSLVPSLVKNIKQNEGFAQQIRIFEIAKTYLPKSIGLPDEEFMLSIVVNTNLEDLKQIIFGLFKELNIEISILQTGDGCHPFFLDTVEGHIIVGKKLFGSFGQVKPALCRNVGIEEKSVYAVELSFKDLMQTARVMPDYKSFSQYAHITLDLTIKKTRSFTDIKKIAFNTSSFLESLSVKDQYQDTITIRCVFTNKLLNITEENAKKEIEKIKEAL
jgi:phenylalanyl-tRNA synthetase beta subunit